MPQGILPWLKMFSSSDGVMLFIWQALHDSWGASNDQHMIYVFLTVPLDSLHLTFGGTRDASMEMIPKKGNLVQYAMTLYLHHLSHHQWGGKHCLHQNHVVHQFFV
jgi:hypothetical protein